MSHRYSSRKWKRRRRKKKRDLSPRWIGIGSNHIVHQLKMDGADLTSPPSSIPVTIHHMSRPTLGFPLGTALLLIIIFCISGIFSCCYHWEKLRSLRHRTHHDLEHDTTTSTAAAATILSTTIPYQHSIPSPPSKLSGDHQECKQGKGKSFPVIMPGDQIPTYMAWPCPNHNQPPLPSLPATEINITTIGVEVEVVIVPAIQSYHSTGTTAPSAN